MRFDRAGLSVLFVLIVLLFAASEGEAKGYRSELNRVTKKGRIYDGHTWDAKLLWHATLVTDEFRRARALRHIELNRLSPIASSRFIADEEATQQNAWEVFVGFYTKSDYKQFTAGADTFWHIQLITPSGETIDPLSVEMVPVTPYTQTLYPYLDRWSRGYRVRFPKADLGKRPRLMLWSVVGESAITWALE